MVTDRVMMEKQCLHFFSAVFHPFLFIIAGNDCLHERLDEFEFQPDWTTDCGLAALKLLKNPHRFIMGNGCLHFFSAVLDRIFSYLQVMITYMRAWMSLRFG